MDYYLKMPGKGIRGCIIDAAPDCYYTRLTLNIRLCIGQRLTSLPL